MNSDPPDNRHAGLSRPAPDTPSAGQIVLARDGSVRKGDIQLYTPGSDVYRQLHQLEGTGPANILLFSRRGTGKSWAIRWFLHRCALKYPGFRYLVTRNSKPELERTHLQFLERDLDELGGTFARVKGEARYANDSSGLFAGFEREADALKLIGADLDCLVVEEGTTVSWPLIVALASSLRTTKTSGRVPQLIIPTNPFGKSAGELKRRFITQDLTQDEEPGYAPADWLAIRTTADDNPHLDFITYDKRLGALRPAQRKAWLLGEWSSAEGSYFDDFQPEKDGKEWHVISRLPDLKTATIYRCVDWGFAPDPCAVLWLAVYPNGRIVVFRERTYLRTPVQEVAAEIIGSSRDLRVAQTFIDPSVFNGSRAGAVSIGDSFENAGVPVTSSVNDRAAAGYSIHEALSTVLDDGLPRLQIWREGCPNLIRTLPLMQANANHPDRIADGEDHWVLALAYFLLGAGPLVKGVPLMGPPSVKPWMKHGQNRGVLGSESVRR
jgi:phage terminase large subunit